MSNIAAIREAADAEISRSFPYVTASQREKIIGAVIAKQSDAVRNESVYRSLAIEPEFIRTDIEVVGSAQPDLVRRIPSADDMHAAWSTRNPNAPPVDSLSQYRRFAAMTEGERLETGVEATAPPAAAVATASAAPSNFAVTVDDAARVLLADFESQIGRKVPGEFRTFVAKAERMTPAEREALVPVARRTLKPEPNHAARARVEEFNRLEKVRPLTPAELLTRAREQEAANK